MNTGYPVSVDTQQKIKLQSNLVSAYWVSQRAYAGLEAFLEVRTSLIGSGAPVEIKVKTEKGKKIGVVKGTITGNRFFGSCVISDKVESGDSAYFEVKLPKHNLNGESERIPCAPRISATKMQWSSKDVRRGDIVTLEAQFEGVADETDAVVIIYEFDKDGNHDIITKMPTVIKNNRLNLQWEFDCHQDVSQIPTEEELKKKGKHYQQPQFYFVVVVDGHRIGVGQESGLLKFVDILNITVNNGEVPAANFELTVKSADGKEHPCKLDANGCVSLADISPGLVIFLEIKPPNS